MEHVPVEGMHDSHHHPNVPFSSSLLVYPLLQLLPVGAHDLRLLPLP